MERDVSALLSGLNPPQREAVVHAGGPLLVLAGAGSGKTRVITHRIAYLIHALGVDPYRILAVTFTNKAAREMRERVEALLDRDCRGLWVRTFHSACARILRAHADRIGYGADFAIYDGRDQKALIRSCLADAEIDPKRYSPEGIHARISRAKNELVGPEEFAGRAAEFGPEAKAAAVYPLYQQRLRENNAVDFDDLLYLTVRLFEKDPEVLALYQERFLHVLVDEYQDTNRAQYRLVRLLTARHRNLCVVGDDDQSIYSWRGAEIGNILSLRRDHPDLRVIRLEQNYRSTQPILAAAWHVVQNNVRREPKKLWTDRAGGDPVTWIEVEDEVEEAEEVARRVREMAGSGLPLSGIAVFYRVNAQSRALEEGFRRFGIPHRVVGAYRFYDRKEVRDLLAYLLVILNPRDGINLRRILNVPPRGVGPATLERLEAYARDRGLALFHAMEAATSQGLLRGKAGSELGRLARLLGELSEQAASLAPSALLERVDRAVGYTAALQASHDPTAEARLENVQELFSAAAEYEERSDEPSLAGFLEEVALVSDADQADADQGAVTLMTLHAAKGLEFPVVFLTGLEEGLLPHKNSLDHPDGLEEERRLCYVGFTRARERLLLLSARSRRIYGFSRGCVPSRFLQEIPGDLLVEEGASPPPPAWGAAAPAPPEAAARPEPQAFPVGSRVYHPLWGHGTVTRSVPSSRGAKVTVRFRQAGTKQLIAEMAGLRRT